MRIQENILRFVDKEYPIDPPDDFSMESILLFSLEISNNQIQMDFEIITNSGNCNELMDKLAKLHNFESTLAIIWSTLV
jgi:hypothetical protein